MNKIECRTIVQSLGVYPVNPEQMRDADKALALEIEDGWTIAGVGVSSDVYDGRAWYTRFVTLTREALPGGGAAAENAEDANVRRHFLALVRYCEDWADVCTDDRKFSIYMTMLKILVHSGELPTEVPADEMHRRLDIVLDVCDAGLDDKTNMPHIRDIYQNIMNLADIGAELPEDAS